MTLAADFNIHPTGPVITMAALWVVAIVWAVVRVRRSRKDNADEPGDNAPKP